MSHRVRIVETDEAFEVAPDESVLDAALRAEIVLPHDCTLGGCGTCRVKLIDGSVTYEELPFALSPEEASAGYALACQARPTSDLVIRPSRVDDVEPKRRTAIIKTIRAVGPRVIHLTLEVSDATPLVYRPGQYMNVLLDDGASHSFSMASTPRERLVDFHIRRLDGGRFTDRTLAQAKVGDALTLELPLGAFTFRREDNRPVLMVATGTGLAPIKAMLEALMEDGNCPPVSLYWGTRTAADLYLHDEIQGWSERLPGFHYVPVLSRAGDDWTGRRGHVQRHIADDFDDLSDHAIYLCGSPAMIADAKRVLLARGACVDHIYAEGFTQHAPL